VALPVWDSMADYRIVVDGKTVTTWTNGVKIHEQTFARNPDPWLLLQTHNPSNPAEIANVQILGTPVIPDEIDLLDVSGLSSWRADVYGEWFQTDEDEEEDNNAPWLRTGNELIGRLVERKNTEFQESLLRYQRPMLEDGVIEFDSWYESGQFSVNPALGKSAWLLTEMGVRRHELTSGPFETTGLTPANQEVVPGAAESLPVKSGEWNHIRLELTGDQLTISVNDVVAATIEVTEPPQRRQFGLFRYSNLTRARVQNLVYRGDWPKTLPAVADQQLAVPQTDAFLSGAVATLEADLSQSAARLQEQKLRITGPDDQHLTSATGLELHLHDTQANQEPPSIQLAELIEGDCEVQVDYSNIRITPHKTGWGVSLVLDVLLDDEQKSRIECAVSLEEQTLIYVSQLLRTHLNDGHHTVDYQKAHIATKSGSLKIVRRGGQMECYARRNDSNEFLLLGSFAVGNGRILEINCGAKASDDVARLDVTLNRISVRQTP
ncbi:MAG: DUF1583 domain-containing protein, partial [Planctomycetaceae bacterium]|nr:DUF1583 domain-containing protein [Planctomycetaceae bacterium]